VFPRETQPGFGRRKHLILPQARILADEFSELLWLGVGIHFATTARQSASVLSVEMLSSSQKTGFWSLFLEVL